MAADSIEHIFCCDKLRETAAALANYIYGSGYQLLVVMESAQAQEIYSQRSYEYFIERLTECSFSDNTAVLDTALIEQNQSIQAGTAFIVVTQRPERLSDDVKEIIRSVRSLHIFDLHEELKAGLSLFAEWMEQYWYAGIVSNANNIQNMKDIRDQFL